MFVGGSVTVSRLTNTAVAVDSRASNRQGHVIRRDRAYNKKSYSGRCKLKKMALFLLKHYEGHKAFITITTTQHKTNVSDATLMQTMGKLLRSEKYFGAEYTLVCERQRDTGDLHFHLLANFQDRSYVDYNKMRAKIAKAFSIGNHPAVLQFDWLTKENAKELIPRYMTKISGYISKESASKKARLNPQPMQSYIGCDVGKFNGSPYSSMFECRTFSVSKSLRSEFRRVADRYELKVNPYIAFKELKKQIHYNDFYSVYKSDDQIFRNIAERAQREFDEPDCGNSPIGGDDPIREGNRANLLQNNSSFDRGLNKGNSSVSERKPPYKDFPTDTGQARSLRFWQKQIKKQIIYESSFQNFNKRQDQNGFVNREPSHIGKRHSATLGKHIYYR